MQIFEVSINYINNRVIEQLKTYKTLKEKETLFFDIIKRYNSEYAKQVHEYYKSLTVKEKNVYFDNVINDGIYVHIPPMWREDTLFDIVAGIRKDYPWTNYMQVYVDRYGRTKIPLAHNNIIIGEQYMIKLKQSSKKGFSARSAGALSKRGVPEKSFKNKAHQDAYSSTPIRIGDQENINSVIGVSPEDIAELHLIYRSSPIARRELGYKLLEKNKPLKDFGSGTMFTNRNVEILQAYLKAMGYKLDYFGQDYVININSGMLKSKNIGDDLVIGTDHDISKYKKRNKVIKKYRDDICFVGSPEEYESIVDSDLKRLELDDEYYVIDI